MMINTVMLFFVPYCVVFAQSNQSTRLLGGSQTTIERYPIIAQLLRDTGIQQYSQYCAGVILTQRHVISAAHCFQYSAKIGRNYTASNFWKIRVGSSFRTRGGSIHDVKYIITNPAFDKKYYNNDVAVVVASKPFILNTRVRQGTIPKQGTETKRNSEVTLLGWGTTMIGGHQPEQLQFVTLRIIDQKICRSRYETITAIITDAMLCAGLLDKGGADGCFGDSGGPLIYNGVVVGLVSFGYACGDPHFPGVYSNLTHFSNWIVETISANK